MSKRKRVNLMMRLLGAWEPTRQQSHNYKQYRDSRRWVRDFRTAIAAGILSE